MCALPWVFIRGSHRDDYHGWAVLIARIVADHYCGPDAALHRTVGAAEIYHGYVAPANPGWRRIGSYDPVLVYSPYFSYIIRYATASYQDALDL